MVVGVGGTNEIELRSGGEQGRRRTLASWRADFGEFRLKGGNDEGRKVFALRPCCLADPVGAREKSWGRVRGEGRAEEEGGGGKEGEDGGPRRPGGRLNER